MYKYKFKKMDEESKKKAIIAVVIVVVILIVGVSIYFYLNSKKKTANTATSNLLTRSNLQSSNLQTSSKLQSINLQSSNLQTLALAGPCSTYTDASPASSVSVACLRDTLKGYGCVESATLYGDLTDNYNGWWKQDTNGAGTFGGIKADMRSYGDATSGDKYTSCKGSSGNSPVVPPTVTPPEVPPTVTPPEVPPTVTPPVVVPAGVAPPVSASGEYHIVTGPGHRVPNKMLLLHGSATNGETTIGTWDYIPDEMICKWKLMPAANNEYHLVTGPRHRVPNKMLFLHGSATNGETTIGTWDYAANDLSTTWKLMSAGADKKYHLVTSPKHRVPNKMLLLHGSATNGETTIGTWDYLPGDTICKWTLMPAAPEPCSRYTDSSRASSVSVACLRDTLKSVGCFEGASLYSELTDNYTGWWKQDTGAGTFGGIKADMRTYGIATFGEKGIACKGNVDSTNEYHLVTGPGHRGVPNKMLYLHGMDTNPVVSSWDYWVDPQTRWKIIYIGNGDYHIVTGSNHKVSNKMLHLDGSDTNGQTTIKGSNYVASNQRIKWKLIPAGADEYHIVSSQDHQVPNKMLLLNGNTTNGETHIGTWDYSPDDTFCKWKVILAPRPETYRYVRIYRDRSGAEHFLNITEVKVLSGNRNVARGKTVTASSIYDQTVQAGNLVDGNRNTLAHTNDGIVEWFLIDLGQEYEIINVEIINRVDCCKNRLKNTKVQLSKAANMSSRKESRVITPTEALNAVITWHVATNDFTFSQSLPSTLSFN